MKINSKEVLGATVLELSGSFTEPEGYALVRHQVKQLLAVGRNRILLDLAKVSEIDSGGLGTLVEAQVSIRRRNGQMKLANLTPRVRKPFELTRLVSFFEMHESPDQALADFKC